MKISKLKTFFFVLPCFLCLIGNSTYASSVIQQEINSGWMLKQVRGNNWYPATVPGVVHTDLMNNGIIEDPYFRLNERGVQWVDKEDWEYKTTLAVTQEIFEKDNIELYFKGLDTYADVYLNDSLVLKANNMFREWRTNVKQLLRLGNNELRIYFHSPIKMDIPKFDAIKYQIDAGNDQSENGGVFNKKVSVFARKAGYHYGWDWGPRLVTSGVWRPAYIVGWNNVRLDNIYYRQEEINAKQAQIKAIAEIVADRDGVVELTVSADGVKNSWTKNASVKKGRNTVEIPVTLQNPRLWWSNGLGEAYRYQFTAKASMNGNSDIKTDKLGLRKLEVIRDKDAAGTTFYFRLNGVNVFAKGANYIPQDNFLNRVTPERHKKTILDAVNANMNMLRIWGGGIYEDDVFYDLCDEYGIMIWQDFMFACSTYPMNPEMLENIHQEAADNIIRLRNHACIALWCGNNENHTAWFNWGWISRYEKMGVLAELRKDYKDVFHDLLPQAVEKYDPVRFYWPSSPYGGNPDAKCETGQPNWNPNGDAHYWGVWHGKDSIANFNVIKARFFSEYGFQSFPEYQSILKYAPEERDHDIYSDVMMAHQRGGSHANRLIEWYLLNEYRKPLNFKSFLYLGQLLQGDAIRTAIEAHRRDMPYCMGTLFWQHNDCWPVASWSSRDYYGRWKAQHYFSRKAYGDILVSPVAKDNNIEVYIVSDRLKAVKGKLFIRVMDLKGNILSKYEKNVVLPANTSQSQFSVAIESIIKDKRRNEIVINARFIENGKTEAVSANYFLTRYKDIDFPKTVITKKTAIAKDGFDVTLESSVFARGVFLCIDGLDNFFSDNYFDLLPNEPVTIHVTSSLSKAEFDRQLQVISISDAY
ncbi:MAG: glycoside hydrolase family 2 protein [Dysgonamonadaceae bacterium]|jgi:beta-mannosidase|nr:glycoside hydrolase family 2 protein [Dysgonamonadaceae bacterium]